MYSTDQIQILPSIYRMKKRYETIRIKQKDISSLLYIQAKAFIIHNFLTQVEVDARSCYVGNVDYGATAEELEQHFHGCGSINRVTILCNKFDGNPKGFAYVEFTDKDSVDTAMALDDSLFRGRQIKVLENTTVLPY